MSDENTKSTNPKDVLGGGRLPLHLWPETATAMGCLALLDGALKYGRCNFRPTGVRMSIYIDALKRHVNALFEGQDTDPFSGLPQESHILACIAIIVDAKAAGMLVDDRQYPGGYLKLVDELTPHVARLKALYVDKSPRHYTIADAPISEAVAPVRVAVGVLFHFGKIFLQRRSLNDENFPGAWECPGGGVQAGETRQEALKRELREELGLTDVRVEHEIWTGANEGYKNRRFEFTFYRVAFDGLPNAIDGQADAGWFTLDSAAQLPLTPANMLAWPSIVDALRG